MTRFKDEKIETNFEFWGVDLVSMFDFIPEEIPNIHLVESSLLDFDTNLFFDLITCIHGIHYLGDKLKIIKKYIGYLKPNSLLVCNLDTNNLFDKNGKPLGRKINACLRNQGLLYDTRLKILRCVGNQSVNWPFQYLGADDQFGENYTGQKTVASYYDVSQSTKQK
jgi:SAM-dependent methyltransferase